MLVIDHQQINVNVGTRTFMANVPDAVSTVTIRLARRTTATPTFWADAVSVSLSSWVSLDGGMTWIEWVGFTAPGGTVVGRDGTELPESRVVARLPSGTARQYRLTVTVAGTRLVTQLTLEVT